MNVYAAFTIVNKDFKMGGNVNTDTLQSLPQEIPNQLLYISSASSIDIDNEISIYSIANFKKL